MPRPKSTRGRQAEAARNDELVLEAAREVFAEVGFDAPIAAVAARAGVGVGTLYRRYGSKEDLLQELCVIAMRQNLAAAEDALLAPDAWSGLTGYVNACVSFRAGAFAPVAGRIEATPEMWRTARAVQTAVDEIVRRAHADGSLRADAHATDVAWLIEHFGRGFPASPTPAQVHVRRRLIAITLAGLRAGSPDPLPGPELSWDEYSRRWAAPD